MIIIATCQYSLELLADWQSYVKKITNLVTEAKKNSAQLLLLPEYAGTEIGGFRQSDKELGEALQPLLNQYFELFKNLAMQEKIYIQPGTILVETAPQQYVNRAYFFSPNGKFSYQDKLQLTEFEKNSKVIIQGKNQTIFATALGKIGIAICYDSEFPEIIRNLTFAGANLILVPSYTNSLAGYNRVFLSCRARAIENQCYVATAFIVGTVETMTPADQTFGQATVVGPVDKRFPDDGILAQGKMNEAGMIIADLDLEKLNWIQKHGQVHNFEDAKMNPSIQINVESL